KRDGMIEATLQTKPEGQTHWSCRTLAKAQGVSKNTVNRLWQMHNLKPASSRNSGRIDSRNSGLSDKGGRK
ncbi:MAG: hypothetical protein NT005_02650, partial [Spirochaetes bacterium]|nr:hypothetical protein [Spirochaetota bacterium]